MRLRRRVQRLEQLLPVRRLPLPEDRSREGRLALIAQRMERLTAQAEELMSAAEREQVRLAGEQLGDEFGGPYGDWLWHLTGGMCRLPELSPAAMKDLLLAWLKAEADRGMVCNQCGLEYPQHRSPRLSEYKLLSGKTPFEGPPPWYDIPYLFEACPHCGGSRHEMDWPHRTWERDYAWKDMDGYAGKATDGALLPRLAEALESTRPRPARPAAGAPAEAEGEPHPFLDVGSCSFPQSDLPTS